MIRTVASLLGLTAAFVLVLFLTYGGSGDSSQSTTATPSSVVQQPTATATPPVTPTPAPLPEVLQESGVTALEIATLIQFPDDMSLILETGCWECGGQATGLRRMYKDADRELRIEQLLSVEDLGLPPLIAQTLGGSEEVPPFITALAVAPDASEMLVSLCVAARCSALPDAGPPLGRAAIFESTDGGITWRELGRDYPPSLRVIGYIAPGVAIVALTDSGTFGITYYRFPGFEPLEHSDGDHPILSPGGDVVWGTKRGPPIRGSGETFLDLGPLTFPGPNAVTYSDVDGLLPLSWFWNSPESSESRYFLSLVNVDGEIAETFETSPVSNNLLTAIPFGDGRAVGTMMVDRGQILGAPPDYIGLLPAILGLESRRYNLIKEPFLEADFEPERDIIHAVQTGPFARIDGTGSCLNLRSFPSLDAAKVACLADGVLLRHDSVAVTNQDVEWLQVTAPDGTRGWAATDFLDYQTPVTSAGSGSTS